MVFIFVFYRVVGKNWWNYKPSNFPGDWVLIEKKSIKNDKYSHEEQFRGSIKDKENMLIYLSDIFSSLKEKEKISEYIIEK